MFFRNHLFLLALKFLWLGLVLGLVYVVVKLVYRASKRNVYVCNFVSFCFWLAFGMSFAWLSVWGYSGRFCWFGLLFIVLGMILVKISIDFFFTKFAGLLYNKFKKLTKGGRNGRLQTKKEV